MTVTLNEETTAGQNGAVGRIARIIGPVVDIEFPVDAMPEMYNALKVEVTLGENTQTITLEVAQHIGEGVVRAISMKPTDGMVRGAQVSDTGEPITVPVGDVTSGTSSTSPATASTSRTTRSWRSRSAGASTARPPRS